MLGLTCRCGKFDLWVRPQIDHGFNTALFKGNLDYDCEINIPNEERAKWSPVSPV